MAAKAALEIASDPNGGGIVARRGGSTNWLHSALGLAQDDNCGLGVVALADIPKGTLLIMYGGAVITDADFSGLPEGMKHFFFQVAERLFIGPVDYRDVGIGERINHSCSPNAGFVGQIALFALRDISKGESITMDYASCVDSDDEIFTMECKCGAENCRKVVTGQDWKLRSVQERLLPHFQPFLKDKAERLQKKDERSNVRLAPKVSNDDGLQQG